MGEVYVAEDSRLKRKVALKVLPEEMARDPVRLERFQREAETIAALNHPNIVTIYSIEEAEGVRFLTMELVEGDTLTRLIPTKGMDVESFVRFSTPVAEALSAAHEKGIIHRDLKPGNIMVSHEGRVKVLDFGLAKLMQDDSDPDSSRMETRAHTEDGIVLGTMPYMSPEQIQGKKLDHRSDIFSLGIIFYEMITGCRPFQGDTSADLISSILRDTPDPVSDLKADLPEHLGRIIRRCLMKDSRDRYQTARDVYNELRDLTTISGSSSRPRVTATAPSAGEMWIAVLPFQHSSEDPEIENFADGLVQDITAALSQFSYLSVIARNSTLRLKGQSYDVRTASEQLGARYVLQGGIRKSGSLIRVNVQLIDAQSGTNLWAETYNRDLQDSDIFATQDNITDRVVATVADGYGVLVRSMAVALADKLDEQLSAAEWVIRLYGYRQKLKPDEHARLKESLERAIEQNPKQADVWACLCQIYVDEYGFGYNTKSDSLERALAAGRRALEIDRTSQLACQLIAQTHFFMRDIAAFRPAAEWAISLNSRDTNTLAILGIMIAHTRDFERAADLTRRAMEINPSHAGWYHFGLIWYHFQKQEYEKALEHANKVNMPGMFWTYLATASINALLDRKAEAVAAIRDLLRLDPDFSAKVRANIEAWHYASGLMDQLLDGLRKAGLEIPESNQPANPQS